MAAADLALDALPLALEFLSVPELGRLAAVCSATASYALQGGDWAQRHDRDRRLLRPLRDPEPFTDDDEAGAFRTAADWRAIYRLDAWRDQLWQRNTEPPFEPRDFIRQRLRGHTDGGEQGIRQSGG